MNILSILPRLWLQNALLEQWARSLPAGEALRLEYFGATGNPIHHGFSWADNLSITANVQGPQA